MTSDDLLQATRIDLRDRWCGLSRASPMRLDVVLQRDDQNGFRGRSELRVGEDRSRRTESLDVTISPGVATAILTALADAPVEPGPYVPWLDHTDDYPEIEIEVLTPAGAATFHSRSQGEHHVPWGLRMNGEELSVNSPLPAEALELLRRCAGGDRLEAMVAEMDWR
jgi:hypothetical protein